MLTEERAAEIDIILYFRQLFISLEGVVENRYDAVKELYTAYASLFDKPTLDTIQVGLIIHHDINAWERVHYLKHLGYSPKTIGDILGWSPRSVSSYLVKRRSRTTRSLMKELERYASKYDLPSMSTPSKVSDFAIPPRNTRCLLL